jgi:NAD(P)-dependent dehydrogenase (short-subunit alcohol dehydrogenase family)
MSKPTALVTGGSRGIGRGIVRELSSTHNVIATFNSNRAAAEEIAATFGAHIFPCQLSNLESIEKLANEVRARFGAIDLLVNNAGMAPRERRDILEATAAAFDELIATNLRGPYFLTQRIARTMLERRSGRIVFIGSMSAFAASTNRGDYCISKAGISMAARLFAARLASENIAVFEIQPGIIRTDMIAQVAAAYEKKISEGLVPQQRMGEPEDVARIVRAIADGHLDYCTGQVLHPDGGFHMRVL